MEQGEFVTRVPNRNFVTVNDTCRLWVVSEWSPLVSLLKIRESASDGTYLWVNDSKDLFFAIYDFNIDCECFSDPHNIAFSDLLYLYLNSHCATLILM